MSYVPSRRSYYIDFKEESDVEAILSLKAVTFDDSELVTISRLAKPTNIFRALLPIE